MSNGAALDFYLRALSTKLAISYTGIFIGPILLRLRILAALDPTILAAFDATITSALSYFWRLLPTLAPILRRSIAAGTLHRLLPTDTILECTPRTGGRFLLHLKSTGRPFAAPEWIFACIDVRICGITRATRPSRLVESLDPVPYELQHRVLPWVQSLLEHAFFDYFAARLPGVIKDHKWTVPQAAELNICTRKLKTALMLRPALLAGGLEAAALLTELDYIRHASVHRVPLDAQRLLAMVDTARLGLLLIEGPGLERFGVVGRIRDVVVRARESWSVKERMEELKEAEEELVFSGVALHEARDELLKRLGSVRGEIRQVDIKVGRNSKARGDAMGAQQLSVLEEEAEEMMFQRIALQEAMGELHQKLVSVKEDIRLQDEKVSENSKAQEEVKGCEVEAMLRDLNILARELSGNSGANQ